MTPRNEAQLLEVAEAMYNEISGADNKEEHASLTQEIYDWLYEGDKPEYTLADVPDLVREWREWDNTDQGDDPETPYSPAEEAYPEIDRGLEYKE